MTSDSEDPDGPNGLGDLGGPEGPLDEIDAAILAQLRAVHAQLDPPPQALTEQVSFALELEDLDVEVARLQDDALIGSGARGGSRTRTLTFETAEISLLVSITELGEGQVRLDGWLAPAGDRRVELRHAATGPGGGAARAAGQRAMVRHVTADEAGRFLFGGLHHGLVQLRIQPPSGRAGRSVITPSIRL
jgi:hypothetical protein